MDQSRHAFYCRCRCGLATGQDIVPETHFLVDVPVNDSLVNALEAKGMIEKQTDEGDRRAPRLAITRAGRTVLVESCDERTRILMALMENLTDEECATLNECLRKLGPRGKN